MSKQWIAILIFTFICFLLWLGFDLFRTPSSFETTPALEEALKPLDPQFNPTAVQQVLSLNERLQPYLATQPSPTASPSSSLTTNLP